MRILLLNQFFVPDTAATGQLLADVADALVAQGHEVHVVCSAGRYAGGKVAGTGQPSRSWVAHRLPALGLGRDTAASRLADWSLFHLLAAARSLTLGRFDVCVALTTPPFIGAVGVWQKKWRGARLVVWTMDLWPEIAEELGSIRKHGFLSRQLRRLALWIWSHADRIISLGEYMTARLCAAGVERSKIVEVPNWAPGEEKKDHPPNTPNTRNGEREELPTEHAEYPPSSGDYGGQAAEKHGRRSTDGEAREGSGGRKEAQKAQEDLRATRKSSDTVAQAPLLGGVRPASEAGRGVGRIESGPYPSAIPDHPPPSTLHPPPTFTVMYSGNMGAPHEFETILDAAERLKEEAIDFVFVGDGSRKNQVVDGARRRQLARVRFSPPTPLDSLPALLKAADVHLISMLSGVEGCIVSSKIYGIMAVGQPVIMVGSTHNEISDLLARSGAGFSVGQGCADELAGRIRELRDNPEAARQMGEAGRRYYEEQLGRERSLAKLVGIISEWGVVSGRVVK